MIGSRAKKAKRSRAFILGCLLAFAFGSNAQETGTGPDLSGLWMETNNYPASSVIRFERSGSQWIGKYSQVSAMQQAMGFRVGEVITRGVLEDGTFKGEVLLKGKPALRESCPDAGLLDQWTPIELKLVDSAKLYGAWLQTYFDTRAGKECNVVGHKWQVYGLERLKLN